MYNPSVPKQDHNPVMPDLLTLTEPPAGLNRPQTPRCAHTHLLTEQAPILRRMRPLVHYAEAKGVPVHRMGVGCLKVNPPEAIIQHVKETALRPEPYPQSYGEDKLLQALSQSLSRHLRQEIRPEDSIIVPGGLGAVFTALSLCTAVNDMVTIVRPSWPNTPLLARFYGRRVTEILTKPEDNGILLFVALFE